ncbi:MAG TPA: XRE family transcriptional regulator [Planctomycetota bacterium]|nr:XRE family transcriptional regulator [Planctomycetota bacterium]
MSIGQRIRTLRLRSRLRLDDVAARCGLSRSMLSKIETGAVKPVVATLVGIAAALRVPVSALIDDAATARTVVARRVAAGDGWETTDKGYGFRLLIGERVDKTMQPFLFRARRGEVKPAPLRHAGEEFVHVLAGELDFRVGATTHHLVAGDCLYFDSDEEHDFAATTAEAVWLAVFHEAGASAPVSRARARPATPRATRSRRR